MHLRSPERTYLCMIYRLTLLRLKLVTFFFFFSFSYLMLPIMGEGKKLTAESPCSQYAEDAKDGNQWRIIDGDNREDIDACVNIDTSISSSLEDSTVSNGSSSDMADDASSSTTSYSSLLHSTGSLYDLSELRAQLPIKRGLSRFYQGKSQSFTSLSRVTSIEDLPKKETPYRRKMKASKSYGGGLDSYKSYTLPKATISKKSSRGSLLSLSSSSKSSFINGSSTSGCRSHLIPVQENLKC